MGTLHCEISQRIGAVIIAPSRMKWLHSQGDGLGFVGSEIVPSLNRGRP